MEANFKRSSMANFLKGKLFWLYFVFLLAYPPFSRVLVAGSNSVSIQNEHENDSFLETRVGIAADLNQQQVLIEKLDEIVRNLSEIVTRLESKLSEPSKGGFIDEKIALETLKSGLQEKEKTDQRKRKLEQRRSGNDVEEEISDGKIRDGDRARAVSVTKYSPFWSERFQFVSAVKLDSLATCINVLPFRDYEGLIKYVAVGDERGSVYVFSRNGDVLVQYHTLSESPITAMVSYMSVYKNETFVVTGHKNGALLMHRIWEGSTGEDWSLLFMENISKFNSSNNGEDGFSITILEVHHAGRMRYILATDASGKIWVFRENGTVHGSAMPASKPLAFLKQRLLFLTESGAGSLDLRSMKVRESECEGLNHSLTRNYVFDATERSKAYGFTSDGELIHVLLLGDIMNFKCRVRSKRKFEMDEPLAFQAIKGYLLVVSEEKVFVYNVSTQHYVRLGAPRIIFSAGLDEIRSSFLNYQTMDDLDAEKRDAIPVIASDREKFVVLGLGGGYVGMYRSNLPVHKGEFNSMFWTSPVLFFVLFLFGAWHFFSKKKEALTSWGPDDPFSSTTATTTSTGAPLGSTTTGDRSFMDSSSRNADMMDLRGGGLRGPPRRYASPPRYPGGATGSFRPASADHNSRTASVDPNFRATSELKFRGSALESSGFPKRREPLFGNSQAGDDSN